MAAKGPQNGYLGVVTLHSKAYRGAKKGVLTSFAPLRISPDIEIHGLREAEMFYMKYKYYKLFSPIIFLILHSMHFSISRLLYCPHDDNKHL